MGKISTSGWRKTIMSWWTICWLTWAALLWIPLTRSSPRSKSINLSYLQRFMNFFGDMSIKSSNNLISNFTNLNKTKKFLSGLTHSFKIKKFLLRSLKRYLIQLILLKITSWKRKRDTKKTLTRILRKFAGKRTKEGFSNSSKMVPVCLTTSNLKRWLMISLSIFTMVKGKRIETKPFLKTCRF